MKKLISLALLAFSGLAVLPAQAGTATGTFDVNITLTSGCKYQKTGDVVFTYTSFQAAAQPATSGGFSLQCTNSLPYALALDLTSVTDTSVELQYTLALNKSSDTGTGSAITYTVTGSMAAAQAGKCATAGGICTNSGSGKTRNLTVTY